MSEITQSVTIDVTTLFPFELDQFQLDAIRAIDQGRNVVVCAPTGAGKTVVAEYAVHRALASRRRCFYTTPLKALSNQKFQDFSRQLGETTVGLLTGDVSINRGAPVVVMTTEVYRNMLYGTNLGDVGTTVAGVESVILDECHFMNDSERGTVWEESIIYTPGSIQLIGLSATIANPQELTDWIARAHRDTSLVSSEFRPVPLRYYFFHKKGLHKLLTPRGTVNPRLIRMSPPPSAAGGRRQRRGRGGMDKVFPEDVVRSLAERDMLPAIYFVFSRRGCEQALRDSRGSLRLSRSEARDLQLAVQEATGANPSLAGHPHVPFLLKGLAVHHAGILPAWKGLVERLFQQGLIKVVFATETLAAGINMPARTTVIQAISKYTGAGHRLLTGSEFLQMSGRAGRRGMDDVGNVVVLHHPREDVRKAAVLARAHPEPLESNFRPTYGMALNLLQRRTMEQSRELVQRSFGQFLAERHDSGLQRQQKRARARLRELAEPLCPGELGDLDAYKKTRSRYQTVLKQARNLHPGRGHSEVAQELDRLRQLRAELKADFEQSPCHNCPEQTPCAEQRRARARLRRDVRSLERRKGEAATPYWEEFTRLVEVLRETRYLDGDRPTETGCMAACFRATNVLLLAEVVASGELHGLTPSQVAAVVTALVTEEGRRIGNLPQMPVSHAVQTALHRVALVADRVDDVQQRYLVDMALFVTPFYSGITEAWCGGMRWDELRERSGLEAGDIVRLLRRTLDVCRQFAYSRGVPEPLARLCLEAERLIARDEVRESLTMVWATEEESDNVVDGAAASG